MRGVIEGVIERDLLRKGKLLATTTPRMAETETAAIVGTPLTIGAIGAGMFFGFRFRHLIDNGTLDGVPFEEL